MAAEGAAAPPTVTTTGGALAYTENDAATAVDAGLTLAEPDLDDVQSATVAFVGGSYQSGQDVLAFSDQLGISGVWNSGAGTLTLTGTAPVADYETALRTVTYQNTSDDPATAARTIRFVVTDVNAESGFGDRTVNVTAVDDPLSINTTGTALAYTENAGALAIDSGVTVTDVDDDITGATVAVSPGSYVSTEDVLAFANQLGITGVWDSNTGVLTLSGATTPANYQTALRTVTYANGNENPNTGPRTVTFTVTSVGSDSSARVIAITAVNDAPDAGGDTTVTDPGGGAANILEDATPSASNIRLTPGTLNDVDSGAPTQVRILSVTGGTLTQGDGSVIGLGTGGSILALAGGNLDMRFTPTANRDTNASFTYMMVDAANSNLNSAASTATVPIIPVNDAPTATMSGGTAGYTENGPAVAIDSAYTNADIDNANLVGATVQITANYDSTQDVLAFANQLGITGSWDSGTGTMTLSGATTVANYQTAIRAVTYANTSEDPAASNRTMTVSVADGTDQSTPVTRQVTVTPANDAPTATASGGSVSYTENATAVTIDTGFAADDVDDTSLTGASVQITGNYESGADVLSFSNQLGISGSWDSGSAVLTLSGVATIADYETALQSVTFHNTSDAPSTAGRTITFIVSDAEDPSSPTTRNVTVAAVNDAPTVDSTAGSLTFTENGSPGDVDDSLTVDDLDDSNLESATVAITAGYWNGEDVLAFTDQLGISGSWNAGTGTLTLTGTAPVGDYQTALRAVTYENTSDAPNAAARTVTYTVNDGDDDSNTATRSVAVTPVNDLPATAVAAGSVSYIEDASPVQIDGTVSVVDADDASLIGARVEITSGYRQGQDALSATSGGGVTATWNAATGVLTLTGSASPATYQTVLRSVAYENTSQEPSTDTRTITFSADDPSGTGNTDTRDIAVTSVNDRPAARNDSGETLQARAVTIDVLDNDTDVEGDALSVTSVRPSNGTATITSHDDVRIDLDDDYYGTMRASYTISDGEDTDTGVIWVRVTPVADISANVTASPNPAVVGADIVGDVVVRNQGPGIATSAVAIVDIGAGNTFAGVSVNGQACAVNANQARCDLGDIAADASALVETTVRAGAEGTLQISALSGSSALDTDENDNFAAAIVTVTRSAVPTNPSPPTRPSRPRVPAPPTTTTTIATVQTTTTSTRPTTTTTRPPRTTTTTTRPKPSPATTVPAPTEEEGDSDGASPALVMTLLAVLFAAVAAIVYGYRRMRQPQ
jgi:hypothetical protein